MTKEQVVKKLQDKGYFAKISDSIVMIYYKEAESPMESIIALMEEYEFKGSYGCKKVKELPSKDISHQQSYTKVTDDDGNESDRSDEQDDDK